METMTNGLAMAIVKDIYRTDFGVIEKKKAIKLMLGMPTINSITKEQLRDVVRWQAGMPRKDEKDGKTK